METVADFATQKKYLVRMRVGTIRPPPSDDGIRVDFHYGNKIAIGFSSLKEELDDGAESNQPVSISPILFLS